MSSQTQTIWGAFTTIQLLCGLFVPYGLFVPFVRGVRSRSMPEYIDQLLDRSGRTLECRPLVSQQIDLDDLFYSALA